jgi:hypothetical protein
MNFALEHNFGAKTVFPKIDVFSNGSANNCNFSIAQQGTIHRSDVDPGPHLLTFL